MQRPRPFRTRPSINCPRGDPLLPQQQCADGQDGPAGKKQHDLGGLYDTRKQPVHHRTSANWRCDWRYDQSGGSIVARSPTVFDVQFSRPQSKCAQDHPVRSAGISVFYGALELSGRVYFKISQITSTMKRKTMVTSSMSINRLFWFCFKS